MEYDNPKVKGILTGKLFEYLYISKKIIAIGCSNKCSAGSLIERCNAGICLGNDISKIKEYILNEVKNKKDNFDEHELNKDMNEINKYSRKLQAEKMLDLVK